MNDLKEKIDTLWFGLVAGILVPLLTFIIYWQVKHPYMDIQAFVQYLIHGNVYTQMMSLCVIPDLALFFIFLQTNKYRGGYGVIFATIILTITNFALKLL